MDKLRKELNFSHIPLFTLTLSITSLYNYDFIILASCLLNLSA